MSDVQTKTTIRVWDLPTRIFHWSLVVLFVIAWVSSESDSLIDIHVFAGEAILALVFFRILWGLIGTRYAVFWNFIKSPATTIAYAKEMITFRPSRHIGHNPLGGWMILSLLMVLALSVISGLATEEDGYIGPLYHTLGFLGDAHEGLANFSIFLVVAHVAGVLVHGVMTGENLPRAMVTGDKQAQPGEEDKGIRTHGFVRAVIALVLSGVAVAWIVGSSEWWGQL